VLVVGVAQLAKASPAASPTLRCAGVIVVPDDHSFGQVTNPACVGPLEVVATVNAPVYAHRWLESVRVFHNVGRITVHLNPVQGPADGVRVAYLGFRTG
jgi:hypothetical protein